MQSERPATVIDPVCGMKVDVAAAEREGLLLERDGRTWAFCGRTCLEAFEASPAEYVVRAEVAAAAPQTDRTMPVIDQGMRRWYESCSCCLSDAYPEIKAQLDAERAAAQEAPVADGICVTAEAAEAETASAARP